MAKNIVSAKEKVLYYINKGQYDNLKENWIKKQDAYFIELKQIWIDDIKGYVTANNVEVIQALVDTMPELTISVTNGLNTDLVKTWFSQIKSLDIGLQKSSIFADYCLKKLGYTNDSMEYEVEDKSAEASIENKTINSQDKQNALEFVKNFFDSKLRKKLVDSDLLAPFSLDKNKLIIKSDKLSNIRYVPNEYGYREDKEIWTLLAQNIRCEGTSLVEQYADFISQMKVYLKEQVKDPKFVAEVLYISVFKNSEDISDDDKLQYIRSICKSGVFTNEKDTERAFLKLVIATNENNQDCADRDERAELDLANVYRTIAATQEAQEALADAVKNVQVTKDAERVARNSLGDIGEELFRHYNGELNYGKENINC